MSQFVERDGSSVTSFSQFGLKMSPSSYFRKYPSHSRRSLVREYCFWTDVTEV